MNMDVSSSFYNGNSSLSDWQLGSPLMHVLRSAAVEAAGGSVAVANTFNYSILSVGVFTLGLLLFVQWTRLYLDHLAQERPLFKAVLERVNHELATLGIVEFVIFVIHKYNPQLDAAKEESFINVHYTLFLVAIFNAVQSILIATRASHLSSRLWVKTEQLEVDHYVEIREEFDRIDQQLFGKRKSLSRQGASRKLVTASDEEHLEFAFEWTWSALRTVWNGIVDAFRHPRLVYKHRNLLTQIRFHELRVQLINEKHLPVQLKISDYLKRSELAVFIKLVHISTCAWVMLTGVLALTYFLMGMVGYVTKDTTSIGEALYYIYVVSAVLFVVVTLVVNNKMKRIFNHIVHKGNRQGSSLRPQPEDSTLSTPESQLNLFWQGEPRLVISILRFMEVGYSLHLGILAVFWGSLGGIRWNLLIVFLACYGVFLLVISRTLPRYTLCTSLGQLVDEERLHETLAHFRLQEAKRKSRQRRDEYENEMKFLSKNEDARTKLTKLLVEPAAKPMDAFETATGFLVRAAHKGAHLLAQELDHVFANISGDTVEPTTTDHDEHHDTFEIEEKHKLFSELVSKKTSSLRRLVSQGNSDSSSSRTRTEDMKGPLRPHSSTEIKTERANSSLEVLPDLGVLSTESLPPAGLSSTSALEKVGELEATANEAPSMDRHALMAKLITMDTSKLRTLVPRESPEVSAARQAALRDLRRKSRRKVLSDGVAAMCQMSGMSAAAQLELSDQEQSKASEAAGSLSAIVPRSKSVAGSSSPSRKSSRPRRDRRKAFSESAAIRAMQENLFDETIPAETEDKLQQSAFNAVPDLRDPHFAIPEVVSDDHSKAQQLKTSAVLIKDDDDDTIDTAGSEGGESDDDDIPDISLSERCRPPEPPKTPYRERLHSFYLSKRFKLISAVSGTLPALFLVGMRVEILLNASRVLPLAENTFKLLPPASFWIEASLLMSFILTSILIMILFRPRKIENDQEKVAFIAAGLDMIISTVCFVLLFVAESQRCCDTDNPRPYLSSSGAGSETGTIIVDCCPRVGRRTYGGLGNIEPFTSLVTLRILRFVIASKIVHWLEKRRSSIILASQGMDEETGGVSGTPNPVQVDQSIKDTNKRKKKIEEEPGTVVELWERAVSQYPDIVAKYGEFSSELLQTMLGIDVVDVIQSKELASITGDEPLPGAESNIGVVPESLKSTFLHARRYSKLVPSVQAVILAGMLGKSVKSAMKINEAFGTAASEDSLVNDATLDEQPASNAASPSSRDSQRPRLLSRDEPPLDSTDNPLEFEIDSSEVDAEMDRVVALFDHPNSRLVRNMRRCDRRFLPYLGHWSAVDVVLTKYELVYFDATEADNFTHLDADPSVAHKVEAIRQAIIATHGGKGLRLCDVAYGRKVAGRIKLTECISAHVDRYVPSVTSDESPGHGDIDPNESMEVVEPEFWKRSGNLAAEVSRGSRWERVKEDHLVISSESGTLQLRFYGDLEYSEAHLDLDTNENEPDGLIHKNNALQWCQTIVRYCGTEQLKQELPHFGDNSVHELRDYLRVLDRTEFHQRRGLVGASQLLLRRQHNRSATPELASIVTRLLSRRPSHIGDDLEDGNAPNPSDRPLHRFQAIVRRASHMAEVEPSDTSSHRCGSDGPLVKRPPRVVRRAVSLGDALPELRSTGGDLDRSTNGVGGGVVGGNHHPTTRPFSSVRFGDNNIPKIPPRRRLWSAGSAVSSPSTELPPVVELRDSMISTPSQDDEPAAPMV